MLFRFITKTSTGAILSEILSLKDCYARAQPPGDPAAWHVKIYSAVLREVDLRLERQGASAIAEPILLSYSEFVAANVPYVTNYLQILPDGLKTPFPAELPMPQEEPPV